jgi:hypothetical protein
MRRRDFIMTTTSAAVAATLPLPALDPAGRMLRVFRQLRVSREGLLPDIALDRMTRTIADLRTAGIEIVGTEVELRREVPVNWRPCAGFSFSRRCGWHEESLAGRCYQRKLRCLICETEELDPEWIRNPILMRSGFYRVKT